MNDQGASLAEGFATDVADQLFLATVQSQMILKRSFGGDRFAAQITLVFVLPHVGLDVEH